ncbi:hypothetical protein ACIBCB_07945 [Streptomyces uncialis]|uniref:hypothetical protein n=1 Tax=Streptomyces uncialis TaxID=1048205 RepID=UPI002253DF1E|nr:hypothetical protein [Streptomyces uncialis]MCX4663995.1 hypothetical protein [Streptomyces uncialis]WTE10982.1 hypothetical protein OG924_12300 [Streptomyces uncialis]
MSGTYRVQYSDEARDARTKMTPQRRRAFDAQIREIAAAPYRYGSPLDGIRERRQHVVAGAVTVYWISDRVVTVSVVRIAHTD